MEPKRTTPNPKATGHETPGHETAGHETKDASIRGIVLTGVGLAIGAAIALSIVYGIFRFLSTQQLTTAPPNSMAETNLQQFPPAPRIEEHPAVELQELHAKEDSLLSSYGWTDKMAGVVRIPIDRAIDLELQRGFPVRKEAAKK
jgi:hypothetical protein